MQWKDFEKIWTQRIIMLSPTENFAETKKYKRNYKAIINLILQFKKQIIIMAIFTAVISGVSAITTQFYSYLIDNIVPNNNLELLIKSILVVCGVFFLTVQLNLMKFDDTLQSYLILVIKENKLYLFMNNFKSKVKFSLFKKLDQSAIDLYANCLSHSIPRSLVYLVPISLSGILVNLSTKSLIRLLIVSICLLVKHNSVSGFTISLFKSIMLSLPILSKT